MSRNDGMKEIKKAFRSKDKLKFSHPSFTVHTARVIFCLVCCFFSSGFALFSTWACFSKNNEQKI